MILNCQKLRITADKRKIKDFPKLPSAISFIRQPLGETASKKDDKNGTKRL